MTKNIERKFTSLKDLKVTDEGSGTIEGYRSVYGVIDEGGDIVVKGAFANTISDFLHLGFTAHSHDWKFSEAVGFPVEAKEDDNGWWVKSQFHSTDDAQDIRTKAKERMEAGKQVGFSFGYAAKKFVHVEAKDYEAELPKYVKADQLPAQLQKAQEFNRIRVLKEVEAIEDSIVTAPMNKRAAATGIKSDDGKGMLADEMAQTTPSFWQTESAACRLVRKIAEGAKNSAVTGIEFDWRAKISALGTEFGIEFAALATNQVEEFLESSDDEFYLKGISGRESFESFEAAGLALTEFAQQMKSNHEWRTKEGRMLSASNRSKVQACLDSMTPVMTMLQDLMDMSEPKPKEKSAEETIDVFALRAQSERVRNRLMRDYA